MGSEHHMIADLDRSSHSYIRIIPERHDRQFPAWTILLFMMALEIKILLFGDQTVDPNPLITGLWHSSKDSITLTAFFDKTSDALRQELALAEPSDRLVFPPFSSIPGLCEAYSRGANPDVAVTTVLLCVYQLGLLLTFVLLQLR